MRSVKMKEMATKYHPKDVEAGKYNFWLEGKFFESGDLSKKPYCIVIPPPNVTGKLHLGHAWDTTLQDIIIRRKRMQGYDALWLPGMDHAGIATQAKIEEKLKEQKQSRYTLGREKCLDVAWQWKEEYASFIREQWAVLGLSLDYKKERFTLDEQLNKAVNTVFVKMYEKGLIYRGERIINWDVEAKTALSNIEVEHKEVNGHLYYFKYPFTDGSGFLEIATTRPETMFGDVAVMVHPEDPRYQDLKGVKVFIPGTERAIPVIFDDYVDPAFGSGVVKVTPAHDVNDFEVGRRHQLAMPHCMEEDGRMNALAHKYEGLNRFDCRKEVVKDLKKIGLLSRIEDHVHAIGHSERTGVIVEPRLSKQWFVKMDVLANNALEKSTVSFVPSRFEKTFARWMENIQDWCISRQLWWGHRIPAWYKDEEVRVSETCPGEGWIQDEDVLDTWFSSALWPFSTLGWPEMTEDFKRYYPTDVLVTGYDIIFFWVSRMIFQAIEFTQESPFKETLIHGLIRDAQGRKMSKSLGNGVDPIEVSETYGADTLRYFLTTNSAPGLDLRYEIEKVESSWNFINKLWNISRFILMNTLGLTKADLVYEGTLNTSQLWILSRLDEVIKEADYNYDKYEFGEVSRGLYSFIWDEFASWYVELAKVDLNANDPRVKKNTQVVLLEVLTAIVKLLHPFMPFVTEEIYQSMPHSHPSITISTWPTHSSMTSLQAKKDMEVIMSAITAVRMMRAEVNKPQSAKLKIFIETHQENITTLMEQEMSYLQKFLNPSELTIASTISLKEEAMSSVQNQFTVHLLVSELVDIALEIQKLSTEVAKLDAEIQRAEKMLSNTNFISKAPESKIQEERQKLEDYKQKREHTNKRLNALRKA